jgi:hypothetical protein
MLTLNAINNPQLAIGAAANVQDGGGNGNGGGGNGNGGGTGNGNASGNSVAASGNTSGAQAANQTVANLSSNNQTTALVVVI